jgi:virulence factor Mce-like protein
MRRPISTRRREVGRQPTKAFLYSLGAIGIASLVVMFVVGYRSPNTIPGRSYYTLHAQFRFADNLTGHYQVRMAGRRVGQVLHPRVDHGMAVIDIQLDPAIKPLRSDTRLRVRPRSVIGVRFLDLVPGSRGTPLANGATIPASHTSASTELDTIFNTLDSERRAKARTLLNELGVGAAGRGDELNKALVAAPDMASDLGQVAAAVVSRRGAAQRLVSSSGAAAAAADPVREAIATGFRPESRALRPFATHATALRATLDEAPSALASVRAGLAQSDPLIAALGGLARAAVPALKPAPRALDATAALLRTAPPGLRDLRSTLDLAQRATAPTLTLLRRLDPVLPSVSDALLSSLPLVNDLGVRGCDISRFAHNWDSMLAYGTTGGPLGALNDLRSNLLFAQESVGGTPARNTFANAYPAPCAVTKDKVGG